MSHRVCPDLSPKDLEASAGAERMTWQVVSILRGQVVTLRDSEQSVQTSDHVEKSYALRYWQQRREGAVR